MGSAMHSGQHALLLQINQIPTDGHIRDAQHFFEVFNSNHTCLIQFLQNDSMSNAKTAVEGKGIAQISDGKKLIPSKIRNIGEDILLEYDVEN